MVLSEFSRGFRFLLAAVLGGFLAPFASVDADQATGSTGGGNERWLDLFNGENLDGWVNVNGAPETWTVRDGMIHCTGKPIGMLRTERQYENFIIELEWRHLSEGGNSGVFLWASPIAAPGVPFLRGIEAQILDHGYGEADWFTTDGDVFPTHGATMIPFPPSHGMRSFPSEARSKGAPEWNHYRIECNDGVVRLHVNGKEVSGGKDSNYRKGYLALEAEGAPVDFRGIRIRELPTTRAPPEMQAPQAEGHRTLYTGTDLRGWRAEGEELSPGAAKRTRSGPWEVDDWRLRLSGSGDGTKPLWTTDQFGDAEFIVDCHVEKPSDGKAVQPELRLRGGNGEQGAAVVLDAAPGAWHRFQVTVRADRVTVLRGDPGVEVDSFALPAGTAKRGAFGLVDVPGAVQFANLYLREFDR